MAIEKTDSQKPVEGYSPTERVKKSTKLEGRMVVPPSSREDTIEVSEKRGMQVSVTEPGNPLPPPPDSRLTTDESMLSGINSLSSSSWFVPSFLVILNTVLLDLLNQQKLLRYKEAMNELTMRLKTFDLGTLNAKLTKMIADKQAMEKFVQAVSSFATAGVSVVNVAQTTASVGQAKREAELENNLQSDIDQYQNLNKNL